MCRTLILTGIGIVALGGLTACTSEPLVSRKGVSGVAVGEFGIEALMAVAALGGATAAPEHLGNFDITNKVYVGGLIPVTMRSGPGSRIDNGTNLFVDGRHHGCLPRVLKVRKPGPHVVHLEIPAFQPYELTLSETIQIRVGQTEVEAWPPVIVDCLSGEIFTTRDTSTVNPDRNSGQHRATDITKKVGGPPVLVVTTTDQKQPGWRKIGQLKAAWGNGVD